MKRWVGVVLLGYALGILLDLLLLYLLQDLDRLIAGRFSGIFTNVLFWVSLFLVPGAFLFWFWIGFPVLALTVFLIVPLALTEGRAVSRWALLGAGLAAGVMAVMLILAVWIVLRDAIALPPQQAAWVEGGLCLLVWGAWGGLFGCSPHGVAPVHVIVRQCRLLRWGALGVILGSVAAEILARVPGGFRALQDKGPFGLCLGVSVLLFSAGPSLFWWLVRRRVNQLPAAEGGKAE